MLQQKVHGEAIKPHPLVRSRGKHTGQRLNAAAGLMVRSVWVGFQVRMLKSIKAHWCTQGPML